jgi:hypothetical protein
MEDFVKDLFHLARAEFAERGIERRTPPQRGMRSGHEATSIGTIGPYEFGTGHDAGDSLCALTFGGAQSVAAALESGFGNDAVHELALFSATVEDTASGLTEYGFGKALGHSIAQGIDGAQAAAEDGWSVQILDHLIPPRRSHECERGTLKRAPR